MHGAAQRLESRGTQASGCVGARLPPHRRLQLLALLVGQQAAERSHAVARQAVPGCEGRRRRTQQGVSGGDR